MREALCFPGFQNIKVLGVQTIAEYKLHPSSTKLKSGPRSRQFLYIKDMKCLSQTIQMEYLSMCQVVLESLRIQCDRPQHRITAPSELNISAK